MHFDFGIQQKLTEEDLKDFQTRCPSTNVLFDLFIKRGQEHIIGTILKITVLPNGNLKIVSWRMGRRNPYGITFTHNPWLRYVLIFPNPYLVKKTENEMEIKSHGEHIKISVVAPKATQ